MGEFCSVKLEPSIATSMRLWLLSVVVLSLVSASQGQGTLLDEIRNFFNRLNPFRPQQSSTSVTSTTPLFRPRPSVGGSSPPPASLDTFSAPNSGSDAMSFSAPDPPPGDVVSFTVPPSGDALSFSAPLRIEPIATPGRGNYNYNGGRYLLTWREGNNGFSWSQARNYCRDNGMRIISLDSPIKREHFLRLVRSENIDFFWAGGRLDHDKTFVSWVNGAGTGITRGFHPWSQGGNRGPQPDGNGAEDCLAVQNNFFNDGVKFHDVGCGDAKPTVCEEV